MKKAIRKIFSVGMAALMSVGVFAGCAPEETPPPVECTHTFSEKWSNDADKHWHDSTCGHDVKSGEANHTFDSNGTCTVCEYHTHVYATGWTSDAKTHWHAALCGHAAKGDEAAHVLNAEKTACSVCGREAVDHARKPVSTTPFKDSYEIGDTRVQLLSNTLVRIENKQNGSFENRESYIVTNRLEWKGAEGEKVTDGDTTKIVTEKYTVVVPNGGSNATEAYITDPAGKTIGRTRADRIPTCIFQAPPTSSKAGILPTAPALFPPTKGTATAWMRRCRAGIFRARRRRISSCSFPTATIRSSAPTT